MSALAEAIDTATRATTSAPQSQGAVDTTDMMIRLIDEILEGITRLPPAQRSALFEEGHLDEDLRVAAQRVRTMHDMAVNIERLGGAVPWRRPVGEALKRLERTLQETAPVTEDVTPAMLVDRARAFLAGTAPERLTATTPQATRQAIALVADMLDQQQGFLTNFLQLHVTLGHEGEPWAQEMQRLLTEMDARREELWSLDVALADAALAESDERIPLEQARRKFGI